MRLWLARHGGLVLGVGATVMLGAGCAGPHSTGALWAQQNVEQETAFFKLNDAQRAAVAHAVELTLADEAIAGERSRLSDAARACPGPFEAMAASPNDAVRDGIRARVQGDPGRLATVAQLALSDWRVRRARATGNSSFCADATSALSGVAFVGEPSSSELLSRLPDATVTRDPRQSTAPLATEPIAETTSKYALGYIDTVHAISPLPQYLGLVYGGFVYPGGAGSPGMDDESAALTVDREAPAYPQWEPDALFAALRARTGTAIPTTQRP